MGYRKHSTIDPEAVESEARRDRTNELWVSSLTLLKGEVSSSETRQSVVNLVLPELHRVAVLCLYQDIRLGIPATFDLDLFGDIGTTRVQHPEFQCLREASLRLPSETIMELILYNYGLPISLLLKILCEGRETWVYIRTRQV